MKTTLLAILALIGLCGKAMSATPSYGSLPGSWTAPVIWSATNTQVNVSTMGATGGPTEVTGNTVYSSITVGTATGTIANYYTNIMIEDVDPSTDVYCGYTSNVSTTTTQGINGAGIMGYRLCTSSPNPTTPPSCSPSNTFYLAPYQQFYCVSASVSKTSPIVVLKWR